MPSHLLQSALTALLLDNQHSRILFTITLGIPLVSLESDFLLPVSFTFSFMEVSFLLVGRANHTLAF